MSTQTTTTEAASGAEGYEPNWPNTDDADWKTVLKVVQGCALSWVPEARIIGNVRAGDIVRSVATALSEPAAPVTGTEEDHRELRAVMRRLSAAKNAGGIEDAEAQAQVLGHAVNACIGQIREFLATAPQPAGAERVDLGELERLSAAATQGFLSISGSRKRYHEDSCVIIDSPNCLGLFALATANGNAALEALADARFAVALWNTYRSGQLVPASLPAALGSGEGTVGATLTGQATQQSPSPAVSALAGECPSRGSAATVEQVPIIRDALIQARGALHLDAMTDEAGKPYGTTTVAQEAISVALAILDAAPNSEAAR
jgi:hypothetical protein